MSKLIFLGTPEFAVPSLMALIKDPRFDVVGVITQPDRPAGRHAIITPPPVKVMAEQNRIPVFQPEKLERNSTYNFLKTANCDVFAVAAYGKIMPQWFLDIPKRGVINVHASLLPRLRGASPIQAAIAAGDKTTGVTIMKIDALLDHGPVLAAAEEPILETDTAESLHDRLAQLSAEILPNALADYLAGKIEPREQDSSQATACRALKREDGKIDWNKSSEQIERMVRAYYPWPGTWTEKYGKRLKILQTKVSPTVSDKYPGEFYFANDSLLAACGDGTALELLTVQPEGKKPMSGHEFALGNPGC